MLRSAISGCAVLLWLAVAASMTTDGAVANAVEPRFAALPGKAVGVLVADAAAVLEQEGRSGPADAVLFSHDGASYRWILLPVIRGETGESATVEVGAATLPKKFENVLLANRSALAARNLAPTYSLVEVEVNGGLGSPATDRFVATGLRRLDGSRQMPMDLAPAVDAALAKCKEQWPAADAQARFDDAQRSALGAQAHLIKEQRTIPFVTWLSNERQVQVTCTVSVSGRERKSGVGIVPDRPHDVQQTPYGKTFEVRWTARYLISQTGQITTAPGARLETFLSELPPPGGSGPQAPQDR